MKKTLGLFYYITVLYGIAAISIDPLIPIISKQLNIGYDKIGLVLLTGYTFSLISSLVTGILCDKINIKKVILGGLAILFMGFLIFGFEISVFIFVISLILQKSGYSSIDSTMHSYVAKVYNNMHAPIFIKIDIMFYIGSIISPLLISFLLFFDISYRYIFFLFAAAILILSLILFVNLKKTDILKIIIDNQDLSDKEEKCHPLTEKRKPNAIIIVACIVMFFSMGSFSGTSSWFTTYLSTFDISVAYGSVWLSVMWTLTVLSLVGYLKIFKRTNEISLLLFGGIMGLIFMTAAALSSDIIIKLTFLLLHAGCFSCFFSMLTSIATYEAHKLKGSIVGIIITCAFSGSIIFQPLLGYFAQYFGSGSVIYVLIGGYSISLIFLFILFYFLKKKHKRMRIIFRFRSHDAKSDVKP
ncbi:MAG: MFS transporter [Candidatus Humimicrobiaceae bacterium]